MDPPITLQLENMCRTCMFRMSHQQQSTEKTEDPVEEQNKLQSIYDVPASRDGTLSIMELLNRTTPQLEVQSTDELPKTLCTPCVEKLVNVHQFQQMCVQVDQKLRIMLRENVTSKSRRCQQMTAEPLDATESVDPLQAGAMNKSEDFLKVELDENLTEEKDIISDENSSVAIKLESQLESDNNDSKRGKDLSNRKMRKRSKLQKSEEKHSELELRNGLGTPTIIKEEVYDPCSDHAIKSSMQLRSFDATKQTLELPSPKSYSCKQCDKVLKTKKTLSKHMRTHEKSLKEQDNLRQQNDNRMATKLQYLCKYCNKSFHQSCTLKDHLRTHTGEQPYLCSECGKAFNSSSNMRQHLLRHTGEKRYECPECPKKFPCLSDLASHKAVHKKFKPHVCDTCGACFGKPYQLKKHKMYHNGEKPHKCEFCEMRFVCADHMRRHTRTHTGEKPYCCKYCVRAFAQSNDLIKHLRTHLGENVYKCELCPKAFRLATELREHFAEHKNDDEETRTRNLEALMEEETKLQTKFDSK